MTAAVALDASVAVVLLSCGQAVALCAAVAARFILGREAHAAHYNSTTEPFLILGRYVRSQNLGLAWFMNDAGGCE